MFFSYDTGLDTLFNAGRKVPRYPLTNFGVDDNNILHIEIAVAGFKRENIEIERVSNKLCVIGKSTEESTNVKYAQKHISSSDFERVLVLHDNYIGGEINAQLEDGILKITIKPKFEERQLISLK